MRKTTRGDILQASHLKENCNRLHLFVNLTVVQILDSYK